MRAGVFGEVDVEVRIKRKAAIRTDIGHDHLPAFLVRIELVVPGGVQGIGPIDAFSVPADFNHLWAIDELFAVGVLGLAGNTAQFYLAVQLRVHRIANIVLMHFTQPPAGHIEVFIIKAKVDVCDQRGHSAEAF